MKRRDFLAAGALFAVGGLGCLGCSSSTEADAGDFPAEASDTSGSQHWGLVVDVRKYNASADIRKISEACHTAHNVPSIDDPKEEIKWIWEEGFEESFADMHNELQAADFKDARIPVMCNHCENPACVKVCPTKATFKRNDGIVEMDYHRCIGCRFCMAACPYGARSLNFSDPADHISQPTPGFPLRMRGVVEKCTLCSGRIDQGEAPYCVEASNGSILFGDLNDPNSDVRKALDGAFSIRRRVSLGTEPSVYYIIEGGQ